MKARVRATGAVSELRDYGPTFTPRYCIGDTFYNIEEIDILTEDEVSIMVNYPGKQQEFILHCKVLHVQDTVQSNGSRKLNIILNDVDPRDEYVKVVPKKTLSESEFSEALKKYMGEDSHEWKELTQDVFVQLYTDYFMSGWTFEEWAKRWKASE